MSFSPGRLGRSYSSLEIRLGRKWWQPQRVASISAQQNPDPRKWQVAECPQSAHSFEATASPVDIFSALGVVMLMALASLDMASPAFPSRYPPLLAVHAGLRE